MSKLHDIIGHESQLNQLHRDWETGNVSHAYLFSGPRHIGKFTVAKHFAGVLLDADATMIAKLLHPDFIVLDQLWMEGECEDWDVIAKSSNVSQEHRKKKNIKTNVISIDDIRVLQERLTETSVTNTPYRVCMIRSIERMNQAAANAFLKILEEPPNGLVFLLTTESLSSLLPTLRSRTRIVPFVRLDTATLAPMLEQFAAEDHELLLRIAGGAAGVLHQCIDDPEILSRHRELHQTASSYWNAESFSQRLNILAPLHTRGKEADDLLLHLGLTLRHASHTTKTLHADAYAKLIAGLHTNAHRQLLTQEFALQVA